MFWNHIICLFGDEFGDEKSKEIISPVLLSSSRQSQWWKKSLVLEVFVNSDWGDNNKGKFRVVVISAFSANTHTGLIFHCRPSRIFLFLVSSAPRSSPPSLHHHHKFNPMILLSGWLFYRQNSEEFPICFAWFCVVHLCACVCVCFSRCAIFKSTTNKKTASPRDIFLCCINKFPRWIWKVKIDTRKSVAFLPSILAVHLSRIQWDDFRRLLIGPSSRLHRANTLTLLSSHPSVNRSN